MGEFVHGGSGLYVELEEGSTALVHRCKIYSNVEGTKPGEMMDTVRGYAVAMGGAGVRLLRGTLTLDTCQRPLPKHRDDTHVQPAPCPCT